MPKKPIHYLAFTLAALLVLRLAGAQVVERFQQAFITKEGIDSSADTRVKEWTAAFNSMKQYPLGVGPDQWRLLSRDIDPDLPEGLAVHSTWLQVGAEFGIPGLFSLMCFYGICLMRLLPIVRRRIGGENPWFAHIALIVFASLVGFIISAQFVTVYRVEIPYYIVLMGAATLKLTSINPEPHAPSTTAEEIQDPSAGLV